MPNEFFCQSCGTILDGREPCLDCHGAALAPLWPAIVARAKEQFATKLAAWQAAQGAGIAVAA